MALGWGWISFDAEMVPCTVVLASRQNDGLEGLRTFVFQPHAKMISLTSTCWQNSQILWKIYYLIELEFLPNKFAHSCPSPSHLLLSSVQNPGNLLLWWSKFPYAFLVTGVVQSVFKKHMCFFSTLIAFFSPGIFLKSAFLCFFGAKMWFFFFCWTSHFYMKILLFWWDS